MAEGRQTDAWDRTAALLATLVNLHRDPRRGKAIDPLDVNPHRAGKPKPVTRRAGVEAFNVFLPPGAEKI